MGRVKIYGKGKIFAKIIKNSTLVISKMKAMDVLTKKDDKKKDSEQKIKPTS
jgi:hypothetical protein